ncbi:DUF5753 domain-containing protein [Amycolatopsis sp. cg9]|uniref:DUF5753 domain-containing protein n=1 Tax=Amycolatopsis sp. cg9 TaxID=3238801 RepID=UPI003526261C
MSPTLRRRRLGRQMRDRRTALKLSGTDIANYIGKMNQSRWSKIEIGKAKLTHFQLGKAVEILQPTPEQAERWHEWWEHGDQLGWWSDYVDVITEHDEMLAGFELDAAHVRQYVDAYIPTLLADEAYTRAVVSASQHTRPVDMSRVVEFRMLRQQRLTDPDFRYTVVIGEAALHGHVGGRLVLASALRHLLDANWAATVEILVAPFTADAYGAKGMSFEITQFSDPEDPEAVFVESGPGSGFLEKPSELRYYNNLFSVAASRAVALDIEDSRRRIEEIWAMYSG